MRSLLFAPADDERKIAKALASGADVVILDLEDSVSAARKPLARTNAARTLSQTRGAGGPRLYVRVNALATRETAADLDAVMPERPDGLMLPKAEGGADVIRFAQLAEADVPVIAIATETASGLLRLGSYANAAPPLVGLTWGIEDLSADLGAETLRTPGGYTDTARLARALCLVGAKAAGVEAIDGVFADFRNIEGFEAECREAARDGFTAKLAIHPAQVEPINRVFTPHPAAVAAAQRIVEAFAAAGDPGVIALDGQMVDRPHLLRAQKLLARAASITGRT